MLHFVNKLISKACNFGLVKTWLRVKKCKLALLIKLKLHFSQSTWAQENLNGLKFERILKHNHRTVQVNNHRVINSRKSQLIHICNTARQLMKCHLAPMLLNGPTECMFVHQISAEKITSLLRRQSEDNGKNPLNCRELCGLSKNYKWLVACIVSS